MIPTSRFNEKLENLTYPKIHFKVCIRGINNRKNEFRRI